MDMLKRLLLVPEMEIALPFAISDVSSMFHSLHVWEEKKEKEKEKKMILKLEKKKNKSKALKGKNHLPNVRTCEHLPVHGTQRSSLSISLSL